MPRTYLFLPYDFVLIELLHLLDLLLGDRGRETAQSVRRPLF